MRQLFYCIFLISLGIAAVMPAAGQITITSSDVDTYLAPGHTTTSKVDTGTHTANIGALGATSWDFSALINNFSQTTVPVNPDTTAFFSYFPGATHAIKVGTGYSYYTLSTNLYFLGYAQPPPTQIRTKDIPSQILDQLPMTMGTTWTASYAESSYVTISGTTYASVSNQVVNYTVDAYGSLTLPGGSVYQALRLKSDRHTTVNSFTFRSITYQFFSKEGASAAVVPADTNQPQTGTISAASMSWNLPGGATSVETIPGGSVPSGFVLEQNYPNPFNPSTVIRYQLSVSSYVTLKVYNLLGQELSTLIAEQLAPGRYSTKWDGTGFPSGVYVYRLQAGAIAETRRFVLMR
ncbi:MAG TPA: T9SS type A sorting domain-containing protein [Bacteroidota bacterium]|jgi:hypothetical protein|nr:T9SS type A sorting domain-containing protein [Bacteroidota bacterium]